MPAIEAEWLRQKLTFDAFYTGYVCEPQIAPILSIMEHCAAPGAVRIVDPVMADNGKLYHGFGDDFPAKMAPSCADSTVLPPPPVRVALSARAPYQNFADVADFARGFLPRTARQGHRRAPPRASSTAGRESRRG